MRKGMGGHQCATSRTEEWLTPPSIIQALGPFDLDPCAPFKQPYRTARLRYTKEADGLAKPWFDVVWLNPPYGREIEKWMKRMAEHNNGIALLFARTETAAFQTWVWPYFRAALFLAGRVRFYTPDGQPAKHTGGAPSVLVAYGKECAARLIKSQLKGGTVIGPAI